MSNLTTEQLLAVNKQNTNIIVSAGAGSGKTTVLKERVLRILNQGIDINKLIILTFTNNAAKEMKERIRKIINDMTIFLFILTPSNIYSSKYFINLFVITL